MTMHELILRGSYFCEKYNFTVIWTVLCFNLFRNICRQISATHKYHSNKRIIAVINYLLYCP